MVPWSGPEGTAGFVDLRENPYDLDRIPEAEQHPALLQALRALNAPRSAVFTAKCDVWAMSPEEVEWLQIELDLTPEDAPAGFASYLDLLWRDRSLFVSFAQQEQRIQRLARLVEPLEEPFAVIDCIVRPAMVDLAGDGSRFQEGFALSLYVKACGADAAQAYTHWGEALGNVVTVLRGKEFTSA